MDNGREACAKANFRELRLVFFRQNISFKRFTTVLWETAVVFSVESVTQSRQEGNESGIY